MRLARPRSDTFKTNATAVQSPYLVISLRSGQPAASCPVRRPPRSSSPASDLRYGLELANDQGATVVGLDALPLEVVAGPVTPPARRPPCGSSSCSKAVATKRSP